MIYIDQFNQLLKNFIISAEGNDILKITSKSNGEKFHIASRKIPRDGILFTDAIFELLKNKRVIDLCSGNGIIAGCCLLNKIKSILRVELLETEITNLYPGHFNSNLIIRSIFDINFKKEFLANDVLLINPPQLEGDYNLDPVNFGGPNGSDFILNFIRKLTKEQYFSLGKKSLFISCFEPIRLAIFNEAKRCNIRYELIKTFRAPLLPSSMLVKVDPNKYLISEIEDVKWISVHAVRLF